MKYKRSEVNKYLVLYELQGSDNKTANENKNDRLATYNDIIFYNLFYLTGKQKKSIIVFNENKTGGMILTDNYFFDRVFKNFQKANRDYEIKISRRIEHINKKNLKVSFTCTKKQGV